MGKRLVENLRRKRCGWCDSEHLRPLFAIEQETPSPKEYWHSIIVVCDNCDRGQLEQTYQDSSDWEKTFDQTEWFLLDEVSMLRLDDFIEQRVVQSQRRVSPCPDPLSPKCLCEVHWRLTEAAKRLESLTDDEMRKTGGLVVAILSLNNAGMPRFEKTY